MITHNINRGSICIKIEIGDREATRIFTNIRLAQVPHKGRLAIFCDRSLTEGPEHNAAMIRVLERRTNCS